MDSLKGRSWGYLESRTIVGSWAEELPPGFDQHILACNRTIFGCKVHMSMCCHTLSCIYRYVHHPTSAKTCCNKNRHCEALPPFCWKVQWYSVIILPGISIVFGCISKIVLQQKVSDHSLDTPKNIDSTLLDIQNTLTGSRYFWTPIKYKYPLKKHQLSISGGIDIYIYTYTYKFQNV